MVCKVNDGLFVDGVPFPIEAELDLGNVGAVDTRDVAGSVEGLSTSFGVVVIGVVVRTLVLELN